MMPGLTNGYLLPEAMVVVEECTEVAELVAGEVRADKEIPMGIMDEAALPVHRPWVGLKVAEVEKFSLNQPKNFSFMFRKVRCKGNNF